MKKSKPVKQFFFKNMSSKQMIDILNKDKPISLKHNEELVNRICVRYPFITKSEVGIIVTAVFSSIRDLLVLGKVLSFNGLFFDMKFHLFDYCRDGHILPSLKVRISTPPQLRKI